jgi:hypothetical protein
MSQHLVKKNVVEVHQNFYHLLELILEINSKPNFNEKEKEISVDEQFEKLLQSHLKLQRQISERNKKKFKQNLVNKKQEFQQKINNLKQQIHQKEQEIMDITTNLSKIHSNINKTFHNTRNIIESTKSPKIIELEHLISYSHKISRSMSAPPNYSEDRFAKVFPPCPTHEQWNFSILYNHNLDTFKGEILTEESKKQESLVQPPETLTGEMNFSYNYQPKKDEMFEEKIELFEMDSSDDSE